MFFIENTLSIIVADFLTQRQSKAHGRPLAQFAFYPDSSTMALNDVFGDGHAKT
jgi:homospermidine synthase